MSSEEQKLQDDKERQEKEQLLIAAAAPFIIDEIPGLGEIQMAGAVLDYIDPYGYNHSLNRQAIDKVASGAVSALVSTKEAMATYLKGGESALTADQMKSIGGPPVPPGVAKNKTMFDKLSATSQSNLITRILAIGTVADPRADNVDALGTCYVQNTKTDMTANCKDPKYVAAYNKFWDDHIDEYKKQAASGAVTGSGMSGWFSNDQNKAITTTDNKIQGQKAKVAGLSAAIALVLIGLIIYSVFFWGDKVSTSLTASPSK